MGTRAARFYWSIAAHVNDTCTNGVFGFTADVHYQSDRHSTLNRAPNFYGN